MGVMEDMQLATAAMLAAKAQLEAYLAALDSVATIIPVPRVYHPDSNVTCWSDVHITATPVITHEQIVPSAYPARRTALIITAQSDVEVLRKSSGLQTLIATVDVVGASKVLRNANAWSYRDDLGAGIADGRATRHVTHIVGAIKAPGVTQVTVRQRAWWSRETPLGSQGANTAWSGMYDNFGLALTEYVVDDAYDLNVNPEVEP